MLTWQAQRVVGGGGPLQQPLMYVYLDSVEFTPAVVPPQPTFAAWSTAWAVGGNVVSVAGAVSASARSTPLMCIAVLRAVELTQSCDAARYAIEVPPAFVSVFGLLAGDLG